jgi:hypothetical protein
LVFERRRKPDALNGANYGAQPAAKIRAIRLRYPAGGPYDCRRNGHSIYPIAHSALEFIERWMMAWGIAWVTMLPVVLLASPIIQRAVERLIEPQKNRDR